MLCRSRLSVVLIAALSRSSHTAIVIAAVVATITIVPISALTIIAWAIIIVTYNNDLFLLFDLTVSGSLPCRSSLCCRCFFRCRYFLFRGCFLCCRCFLFHGCFFCCRSFGDFLRSRLLFSLCRSLLCTKSTSYHLCHILFHRALCSLYFNSFILKHRNDFLALLIKLFCKLIYFHFCHS